MTKKVLVTGASGFAGAYMCNYLKALKAGPEVIGVDIGEAGPAGCDSYHRMDLSVLDNTVDLIERTKPNYIIHLAGTFGANDPSEAYQVNVLSMIGLLEAVRKHAGEAVIVAAGSAAEYGSIKADDLPIDEQSPCRPVTPYGLSKYMATQAAMYYSRVHGVWVMIVRPFQLVGKGVSSRLAPGAFAAALKEAMSKKDKTIRVGNLESSRDFLDINDAVDGIWRLCQKPAGGEVFNLCSGKPVKVETLLGMMIEALNADIKIEVDPALLRGKADVPKVYGSYTKIKNHCGWEPKTSLAHSIEQMLA